MKAVFALALLFSLNSFAENGGRASIPNEMKVEAFTRYILGPAGLKLSVQNYVRTVDLDQITDLDLDVKATFQRALKEGLLQDVDSPNNYLIGLDKCKSAEDVSNHYYFDPKVRTWTQTGKDGKPNIGGKICFDVENLVKDYVAQGLSLENAARDLLASAVNDHTLHFQMASNSPKIIQAQENEAKAVGSYVLRTALLDRSFKWSNGKIFRGLDPKLKDLIDGWNFESSNHSCGIHVEVTEGKLIVTNILPPSMDGEHYQCNTDAKSCIGQTYQVDCEEPSKCGSFTILENGDIFNAYGIKNFRYNQAKAWWCIR